MMYVVVNSREEYLNRHGKFGPLVSAALFRPFEAFKKITIHRGTAALQVDIPLTRNRTQSGFAFLLELLFVAAILLIMAAIAVPNLYRIQLNQQAAFAKHQVQNVSWARGAIAICNTTPATCTPGPAILALVPAPGSTLTTGAFTFTMSADGTTYAATPTNPQAGQQTYLVGSDGIVQCGGQPCIQ